MPGGAADYWIVEPDAPLLAPRATRLAVDGTSGAVLAVREPRDPSRVALQR
jgi:hypothetical protein